jgi:hypothetical protein
MVTLPCGTFQTALINSLHAMHLPVHYLHFFISSTKNKSSAPSGILHMHEKHLFPKITSVCKQFVFALSSFLRAMANGRCGCTVTHTDCRVQHLLTSSRWITCQSGTGRPAHGRPRVAGWPAPSMSLNDW